MHSEIKLRDALSIPVCQTCISYKVPPRVPNPEFFVFKVLYNFVIYFQVTQEVAQILKTKGYMLTCRGTISVKGKGDMVTYFLDAMAPKE